MSDLNGILRRSTMLDTSGAYTPPAIQATIQQRLGGGVYTDNSSDGTDANATLSGRISLSIVAAMVVGALLFYVWTHEIQGGG